jgi:hypothetical protein
MSTAHVVLLVGQPLTDFLSLCNDLTMAPNLNNVRVMIDDEGVKVSVNGSVWTPGLQSQPTDVTGPVPEFPTE